MTLVLSCGGNRQRTDSNATPFTGDRIAVIGPTIYNFDRLAKKAFRYRSPISRIQLDEMVETNRIYTEESMDILFDVVPGNSFVASPQYLELLDERCPSNFFCGLVRLDRDRRYWGGNLLSADMPKKKAGELCRALGVDGVMIVNTHWQYTTAYRDTAFVSSVFRIHGRDGEASILHRTEAQNAILPVENNSQEFGFQAFSRAYEDSVDLAVKKILISRGGI